MKSLAHTTATVGATLEPPWRRSALAAIFALGLTLRIWNTWSAVVHPDELHYVGDAAWALLQPHPPGTFEFLRKHPKPHPRLNPETGAIDIWEPGGGYDQGHPCLYAYALGGVFAVLHPRWPLAAIGVGRLLNAAGDATTILFLPPLVATLGASIGAGLTAATLYAVYPPAIVYGSIGNIDPWLAPLLVLALWLVLGRSAAWRAALAGAVAGLLVSEKQTGLIVILVAPVVGIAFGRMRFRHVLLWGVSAAAVAVALTSPAVYADNVLHPSTTMGQVHWTPIATLSANVGYLTRPAAYYWLSFTRHGEPLASPFGRPHYFLTPAYMAGFLLAFLGTVLRRRVVEFLTLWLPVLVTLVIIVPTDGLWRFHMISPLLCAGLACELGRLGWRGRTGLVGVAALTGLATAAPLPLPPSGRVDLGNLLVMNPSARQPQTVFNDRRPFLMQLGPEMQISRTLWLPQGDYEVTADASGDFHLAIDDQVAGPGSTPVALRGWLHRLDLCAPQGGTLSSLTIVPRSPSENTPGD